MEDMIYRKSKLNNDLYCTYARTALQTLEVRAPLPIQRQPGRYRAIGEEVNDIGVRVYGSILLVSHVDDWIFLVPRMETEGQAKPCQAKSSHGHFIQNDEIHLPPTSNHHL